MPFSVKALVNDTVGTLMASAYVDGKTQIGSIYGTGNNAAYMERSDQVRKANGIALPGDSHMAINCEYGAFDNSAKVLPFTQYDIEIDRSSPRPGEQRYEKLVAGLYLGEIMRLILVDLHARDKVFRGQDGSRLRRPYALDSSVLANMETDRAGVSSRILLRETLGVTPDVSECKFCSAVARLVSRRSVRLYACGIAALVRKRGMKQPHVAVDGSVFAKYPGFPERAMEALREILGLPQGSDEPVRFVPAVDGSSVGAAVIAAMATKLERE